MSAGVWTYLPLGWRVHRKVEQIIREEQDAIGAQEMLMPVLTPAELWEQSGRDYIDEIFRLKDRYGREYVLPMTHEETVTFHAREPPELPAAAADALPLLGQGARRAALRGGLIRVREFIMKDAYSFDRDEEGLERSFRAQEGRTTASSSGAGSRCTPWRPSRG